MWEPLLKSEEVQDGNSNVINLNLKPSKCGALHRSHAMKPVLAGGFRHKRSAHSLESSSSSPFSRYSGGVRQGRRPEKANLRANKEGTGGCRGTSTKLHWLPQTLLSYQAKVLTIGESTASTMACQALADLLSLEKEQRQTKQNKTKTKPICFSQDSGKDYCCQQKVEAKTLYLGGKSGYRYQTDVYSC